MHRHLLLLLLGALLHWKVLLQWIGLQVDMASTAPLEVWPVAIIVARCATKPMTVGKLLGRTILANNWRAIRDLSIPYAMVGLLDSFACDTLLSLA